MSTYLVTLDVEGVSQAWYVTASDFEDAEREAKARVNARFRVELRSTQYVPEVKEVQP